MLWHPLCSNPYLNLLGQDVLLHDPHPCPVVCLKKALSILLELSPVFGCFLKPVNIAKLRDRSSNRFASQPKPYHNVPCIGVYVAHHGHLMASFLVGGLIDTDGVDPQTGLKLAAACFMEEVPQIPTNCERLAVDFDLFRECLVTPNIR